MGMEEDLDEKFTYCDCLVPCGDPCRICERPVWHYSREKEENV